MIQRIQSLYLLVVALLSGLLFSMPVLSFSVISEPFFYDLHLTGLVAKGGTEILISSSPLVMMVALNCIVAVVTIFLFKKRMLQVRLTIFNIVCLIGFVPLLWYFVHRVQVAYNADIIFNLIAAVPVINILLSILALKAIGKDEALIRSIDRIR